MFFFPFVTRCVVSTLIFWQVFWVAVWIVKHCRHCPRNDRANDRRSNHPKGPSKGLQKKKQLYIYLRFGWPHVHHLLPPPLPNYHGWPFSLKPPGSPDPRIGLTWTVLILPFLSVVCIAFLLFEQGLREEWQRVFFITAAVYTLGAILFALLARGEEQPWAKYDREETEKSQESVEMNWKSKEKGLREMQWNPKSAGFIGVPCVDVTINIWESIISQKKNLVGLILSWQHNHVILTLPKHTILLDFGQ